MEYAIGSDHLPGLSKLTEECGELLQVIGKIMGLGHAGRHWDGSDLTVCLYEEMSDVMAALYFVKENCGLDHERLVARTVEKVKLFQSWHDAANPGVDDGVG